MDVKQKVKELAAARGMSMYSLAQAADLTQTCLANWYGKRNYEPSVAALEKVAKALDVTMAELFCDNTEQMYPLSAETQQLFVDWQKLNEEQKKAVTGIIDCFIGNSRSYVKTENKDEK